MKKYLVLPFLCLPMVGCGEVSDTDTTTTLEYYVNKDDGKCTIGQTKGTTVVGGPYATRDEAKAKKNSDPACAETETPPPPAPPAPPTDTPPPETPQL